MKKRTVIFLATFAALLTSCTLDEFFQETGLTGTTTVTFTPGFGTGDGGAATKAFADTPQIENLYLAVFNEGGKALIEYVKAEPFVTADEKYSYTATLKTSSKPRVIHFIANAPDELGYGSDVDAVGALNYSFDTESWTGQDAYWGYLQLDNGICEETDPGFDSLEEALSDVRLVRNFAKIKVEGAEGSNFTITRFWISNFPDRATASPYNRNARRFETQYAAYTRVTTAMAAGYMGFCPASSGLVSLSGLDDTKLSAIACAPGSFAYTYECEKPTSDPLCIIVGGTSTLSSDETFYKIELRDNDGKYLPVLRNFSYTVTIGDVFKVGEQSVEAALNSVASGAIDTDLSLQGLKDLSNGKSRIAVSETERVLFDSQPFELLYSFIPDIADGTIVNKTLAQWVSEGSYANEDAALAAHEPYVAIGFKYGLSGNVIDSYVIDTYEIATGDEIDGYRKVTMTPVPASDIIKNEVVTITGHVWNAENGRYETLQRTVNYQIRPRLDMTLTMTPDRIPMVVGTPINLTIGIEENLPKSLFTLDMKITSEQMTLTPNGSTMSISSEVGADGKPTFFITRAITWEEYSSTPSVKDADGILRKHFDCPLKVNTSHFQDVDPSFGKGDKVLVSNVDFNTGTALFMVGDDDLNRFINPHLDKEYLVDGRSANIVFGMTGLPSDSTVFVRMLGMEPVDAAALEYKGEYTEDTRYSVYEMAVSNEKSESFAVRATSGSGQAYYQLFDDEFNGYAPAEIQIQTPDFTNLRFNFNNLDYVVAGKQAKAMFHMDYIPLDGQVKMYLRNAVPVETLSGTTETGGYTSYLIPVTTNDVEFPVMISPASEGEDKAYFKLTADSYEGSTVAEANIQKLGFSNLKLINLGNTAADYVIGGRPARIDFTLDNMPSDNKITIRLTNLTLGSGRSGVSAVTDNGDGSYDLTVTGKHVLLDVTPATGVNAASYELTDTEFETGGFSAQIRKLSFRNLDLINMKNLNVLFVQAGKPARVEFTLEEMPSDNKVTIRLTNLTLGSGMSGVSAVTDNHNGSFDLTLTGTAVRLDVTPETGVEEAAFRLTHDEFEAAEFAATVKKNLFSALKINLNEGEGTLAPGESCTISFNVDGIPSDHKVTLWLCDATVDGVTPTGEDDGDGYWAYTVDVTSTTTILNITASSDPEWGWVNFYLTDDEFEDSDYCDDWIDIE